MRRLPLLAVVAGIALPCLASSCSHEGDSVVYVNVRAGNSFLAAYQLNARLSNGGQHDMKLYPPAAGTSPIEFPTAFTITLPRDRTGSLDIALDALGANGGVVANGAGSNVLAPGAQITIDITLLAGASTCGNGILDAGEQCDDGDRFTNGSCDFQCHNVLFGTGGATGAGGGNGAGGIVAPGTGGGIVSSGTGGRGALGSGGAGNGAGGNGSGTGGVIAPGTGGRGTGGVVISSGTGGAVTPGTGGRGTGGVVVSSGTGGRGTGGAALGTGGFDCTAEQLINGTFELPNGGEWQTKSPTSSPILYASSDPLLKATGVRAASGEYLAWLGEGIAPPDGGEEMLSQSLSIPGPVSNLLLQGLVNIQPANGNGCSPGCAPPIVIEVLDGTAKPFVIKDWTAADVKSDWIAFSAVFQPDQLASRDIVLRFHLTNAGASKAFFNVFFDQLSLRPTLCNGAPGGP